MHADEDAVPRDLQILLHVVGSLLERETVRRGRVLGRIRRGPAVGDVRLARVLRLRRPESQAQRIELLP